MNQSFLKSKVEREKMKTNKQLREEISQLNNIIKDKDWTILKMAKEIIRLKRNKGGEGEDGH